MCAYRWLISRAFVTVTAVTVTHVVTMCLLNMCGKPLEINGPKQHVLFSMLKKYFTTKLFAYQLLTVWDHEFLKKYMFGK